MSTEMVEKKKQEDEAVKKEEEAIKKDLKDAKDDICPYCFQAISTYPYVNFHPVLGWLECASCGLVFSPKSIRNIKIRKATQRIEVPNLIVPK